MEHVYYQMHHKWIAHLNNDKEWGVTLGVTK